MKLLILFPKENNPKSLIGLHFQLHKSLRIFFGKSTKVQSEIEPHTSFSSNVSLYQARVPRPVSCCPRSDLDI